MAKERVWKPTPEERIDWNHPYIQMTGMAPGYLVQELHGFADTTWEAKLSEHRNVVIAINRKPWIPVDLVRVFGCATSEIERNGPDRGEGCGDKP